MNRKHWIIGALFGVLLLVFAAALAQPVPVPLDSLVTGTPTQIGDFIIELSQIVAAALLAYLSTHFLKKFKGVQEWITMILGGTAAVLIAWGLNYFANQVFHINTGISVPLKGVSGFFLASLSFKFRQWKLARA